jgi:deoxyribodipyrimidine photo-lyase
MKTAIVWFKTDLRLNDNETLVNALTQSECIIPVYCIDESHFKKTEFGFNKTGAIRAKFLLESLQNLDHNLRDLGSGLIVLQGNPAIEIPKIVQKYKAQKVFAKKEVAYEEIKTHEAVEAALWKMQIPIETYSTSTLYHAKDLPFALKDIPEVFTNFRKKVETESQIRTIFNKPTSIKSPIIEDLQLPTLKSLGLNNVIDDCRAAIQFKGGESAALDRLNHYFFETKAISNYKETRNGLVGANYSSKFSAWMAMGALSPRTIYYELKKYEAIHGANKSTYWLVFELLWRDYFRFMIKKHRTQFFLQKGLKENNINPKKHNPAKFEAWKNGKTGVDFIDANMLELKHTGFMSNRGRQNVASYLCHNLNLDWRYGAAYFEEQLIDYDVCSNWGNWSYVAGVGNDPRENRIFNIEKQANEYDKNLSFRHLWLSNTIDINNN